MNSENRPLTTFAAIAFWICSSLFCEAADTLDDSAEASKKLNAEIEQLIKQLTAERFETRYQAAQRLKKVGPPALPALEKLAKSPSPEVKVRARQIVEAIKRKGSGAIDIQPKANHMLNQKFGRFEGNTLDSLPRGVQDLGGLTFHIADGAIVLGSDRAPGRPREIEGIKVGRKCGQLHMLQASIFGGNFEAEDGDSIAKYIVRYEDETKEEIPVEFGVDVRDWWNDDDSKPVKRGKVAWEGNNRVAKGWGHSLRLYSGSWKNPHPEKLITALDYVATHKTAAPFCVAITGEDVVGEGEGDSD